MRASERQAARNWCRCASVVVALCTTLPSHAAGASFAAVLGGSGQDYAASVASDSSGNTYVAGLTYSPDLHVTPGAFQTTIGGNGTLSNPSSIAGDAFVAKFGPDGALLWSTFLGGSGIDYATGVGVDAAGNVLVTGWTRSADFPVFHPLQATMNNGVSPYRWDAFVTKLDPTGSKLIYSTYLGGPDDDGAYGLAVDAGGNAYVTGSVQAAAGFTGFGSSATGFGLFVTKINPQGVLVYSFFQPNVSFADGYSTAAIALDATGSAYVTATVSSYYPITPTATFGPLGSTQALVFKLAPDGSRTVYQTTLGGSVDAAGLAIAVDYTGAAYIGGITTSVDYPLVRPMQSNMGARPLWKSTDGGATWAPQDNLPFAFLQALVVDPATQNTLYAATGDVGIFKSLDGGVTWTAVNHGLTTTHLQTLAIDRLHPQTLYTAAAANAPGGITINRTVDGGSDWTTVDSSSNTGTVQLAIDAQNSNNVYWNGSGIARKSTDGGNTWTTVRFPGTSIQSLALDPHVSGGIYAYSVPILMKPPAPSTPSYIWHSADGGATWTQIANPPPGYPPAD